MPEDHYEIWGGWTDIDGDLGQDEFLETVMGDIVEARRAAEEYRKNGDRYAYIRDMNDEGTIVQ